MRAGILVLACSDVRLTANVVDEVGPPAGFLGFAAGIAVLGPFAMASISDNSSRFSTQTPAPQQGNWIALLIGSIAVTGIVGFAREVTAVPLTGGNTLVFSAGGAFLAAATAEHAGMAANSLSGGGVTPTCLVRVAGDVVAEGNQCDHAGTGDQLRAMLLTAHSITATSNRAREPRATIVLEVDPKRFAAVGNLAAGGTFLGTAALPAPWAPLDPAVP